MRGFEPRSTPHSCCFINVTLFIHETMLHVKSYYRIDINTIMKHKHHIVPKHAGGSDDSSNIIELTPEEHANAHRLLWEEHGRWQDYCAWKGLEGLASRAEHIKLVLSESAKASNKRRKGIKYKSTGKYSKTGEPRNHKGANNPCAREFLITHPDGTEEKVTSLKTWCESKDLNYNSFHAQSKRGRPHKGYTAVRV